MKTPILFDYFRINREFDYSVIKSVKGLNKILKSLGLETEIVFPKIYQKYLMGFCSNLPLYNQYYKRKTYYKLSFYQSKLITNLVEDSDLVFLYEGTPGIKSILDNNNVSYIDFRVSPLRFKKELFLDIAINKHDNSTLWFKKILKLSQLKFKDSLYLKSKSPASTLVYIGQKEGDVAMLDSVHGQLSWDKFSAQVKLLSKNYKKILYRAHPLSNGSDFKKINKILPNIELDTKQSVYNLFDGEHAFCALSSSVLEEASIFKIKSYRLMQSYPLIADCDHTRFRNVSIKKVAKLLGVDNYENVRKLMGGKWSPSID